MGYLYGDKAAAHHLGTVIRLPDGRFATTVYNGLDGVGIKWGEYNPDPEQFAGSSGNLVRWEPPDGFDWFPEAMLREPYPGSDLPCVGEEFEVIRDARLEREAANRPAGEGRDERTNGRVERLH